MLISETYEQHLRRRIILHLRIFFADQAKPQEGEELGGVNRPDKSDLTGGLIVALIRRIAQKRKLICASADWASHREA
jgi:hypothetical protein